MYHPPKTASNFSSKKIFAHTSPPISRGRSRGSGGLRRRLGRRGEEGDHVVARARAELAGGAVQKHAHRRLRDPHFVGDELVGVAEAGEAERLPLARGQRLEPRRIRLVATRQKVPLAAALEVLDQRPAGGD